MKVLHITYWFPNLTNDKEALWIKKHIESLPNDAESTVLHFEIKFAKSFKWIRSKRSKLSQLILIIPFKIWAVIELMCAFWLFYQFAVKKVHKNHDVINFHIAYPMLTYWHWIKRYVNKPVVITEHWSAYHFRFNVKKELPRVERIFRQDIPVISVSQSLIDDIKKFAKADFTSYVVPNIVDKKVFFSDERIKRENYFFMVSQWKWPKKPLVILEAFKQFVVNSPGYKLIIGGYGSQYDQMRDWVIENNIDEFVTFTGMLDEEEIATYLKKCSAFIHCSEYETFSVVCAEAVSCHTPVLASNVGGIPEVIGEREGILINSFNSEDWLQAMKSYSGNQFKFQNNLKFDRDSVGKHYYQILNRCLDDFDQ